MTVDPEDQPDIPKVGDLAWHINGLDPREVTKVQRSLDGEWFVWLWLLAAESGPFPADNYTFTRKEE